jgi:hypothetical protein
VKTKTVPPPEAWDSWRQYPCQMCGCPLDRHEIEPPYPCFECECGGFLYYVLDRKAKGMP